jgi:uncharacterized protein YjiS (DUF1127 family)
MLTCMHTMLGKLIDWMAERQQRCTMRELQRLDDRTLIDIGLDPGEIARIKRTDGLDVHSRGRRRALMAKSSWGIMAERQRRLALRPTQVRLLALLAVLGALLPLGIVAAASAQTDQPIRSVTPVTPFATGSANDISARDWTD